MRERGFPGCEVFDCFGAGQQLTQVTFGGRTWRGTPELAAAQFALLPVMRQLHEVLWYLTEVLARPEVVTLRAEIRSAADRVEQLSGGAPEELAALDAGALRVEVGELLGRVGALVRNLAAPDRRGADLTGRDLRQARLRDASLGGAYLIGADLRGVHLGTAASSGPTCAQRTSGERT